MIYLKAFVAGFASTPVFQQGLLWLLYAAGAANQMTSPTPWCFSRPMTAATSRERNCLWMAVSHKYRPLPQMMLRHETRNNL